MKTAKIILTDDQAADLLRQMGGGSAIGRAWAVVAPGSYPTAPGKLVLTLVECPSMTAANGACRVARGEAVARKARTANP